MVTLKPGADPKPEKPVRDPELLAENRLRCFRRDDFRCRRCGVGPTVVNPLEADHILNRSQGGSDELDNLQTLCQRCHRWKTENPVAANRLGLARSPALDDAAGPTWAVLVDVAEERVRQEAKWGDQSLAWIDDSGVALSVLVEEVGEVAKSLLEEPIRLTREELVQVAAVATAWVEAIDRHRGAS